MTDVSQSAALPNPKTRSANGNETTRAPRKRRQIREAEVAAAREAGYSTAVSNLSYAPQSDMTLDEYSEAFWKHQFDIAENTIEDFKNPELPLARVKRVMKTDPEVAMIASEVPVILEKACQIFISDLTARAFLSSTRRKTLNKQDIANASTQDDSFDFLIDILQRDQVVGKQKHVLVDAEQTAQSAPVSVPTPLNFETQAVEIEQRSEASTPEADEDDENDEDYREG